MHQAQTKSTLSYAHLPTLRKLLVTRMLIVLVGLGLVVVVVFSLGVREVSLDTTQRNAVQLVEQANGQFLGFLARADGLGSTLAKRWADGGFDPAAGFLPDPLLAKAGSMSSLTRLIAARADGKTLILSWEGGIWVRKTLLPTQDGRSLQETRWANPAHNRPPPAESREIEWDARRRPWFLHAMARSAPSWTPVYRNLQGAPCVTFTIPVRNADGNLLGVVALDYFLRDLGQLLREVLPTPHSQSLILDGDGQILASSSGFGDSLNTRLDAPVHRRSIADPPGVANAFVAFQKNPGTLGATSFRSKGQLVVLVPFNSGTGLRWISMVFIPYSDLASSPWADALVPLAVLLVIVLLATWQIARVAGKVVAPLPGLARRVAGAAQDPAMEGSSSGIQEFRMLEDSLRHAWGGQLEAQRLREQVLHLERVQLAGTLTSGLAHDLGNLLTAATLSLDLHAEAQDNTGAKPSNYLEGARKAIDRGSILVGSLMDFCRSVQTEKRLMDLGGTAAELQPILIALLGRKASLDLDVQEAWVWANKVQIEQIIVNLVLNARDVVQESGTVRLKVTRQDGQVHLEVTDNGGGIPAEFLPRIFEPFFTTKSEGRGTGLGLAMVRQIAEEHGGSIEARNQPEGGASFLLRLPEVPSP